MIQITQEQWQELHNKTQDAFANLEQQYSYENAVRSFLSIVVANEVINGNAEDMLEYINNLIRVFKEEFADEIKQRELH